LIKLNNICVALTKKQLFCLAMDCLAWKFHTKPYSYGKYHFQVNLGILPFYHL
jgi:hypothetical protein